MNTELIEIWIELGSQDRILALVTLAAAACLIFAGLVAVSDRRWMLASVFWLGAAVAGAIPFFALDATLGRQIVPEVSAGGVFWPRGSFAAVTEEYSKGGEPAILVLAKQKGWSVSVHRKLKQIP